MDQLVLVPQRPLDSWNYRSSWSSSWSGRKSAGGLALFPKNCPLGPYKGRRGGGALLIAACGGLSRLRRCTFKAGGRTGGSGASCILPRGRGEGCRASWMRAGGIDLARMDQMNMGACAGAAGGGACPGFCSRRQRRSMGGCHSGGAGCGGCGAASGSASCSTSGGSSCGACGA